VSANKLVSHESILKSIVTLSLLAHASTINAGELYCRALIDPGTSPLCPRQLIGTPPAVPTNPPPPNDHYNDSPVVACHHNPGGQGNGQPLLLPGFVSTALGNGQWMNDRPFSTVGKKSVYLDYLVFNVRHFIFSDTFLRGSNSVSMRIVKSNIFSSITKDMIISPGETVYDETVGFNFVDPNYSTSGQLSFWVPTHTTNNWVIVFSQGGTNPNGTSWKLNTSVCSLPLIEAGATISLPTPRPTPSPDVVAPVDPVVRPR
jgi:hypothetical protein